MAHKIACEPSKLTFGGPAGLAEFEATLATVIPLYVSLVKKRKSGPLKNCESPRKYDNDSPNDPWQILLISTPVNTQNRQIHVDLWDCIIELNIETVLHSPVVEHTKQLLKFTLIT